jgi:hypothetical protein
MGAAPSQTLTKVFVKQTPGITSHHDYLVIK